VAIAGLTHPTLVECNGIIYVTGYRGGAVYLRRSADGGRTWLRFADGSEERLVASGADEARAGLVKLESQGRVLMVAVSRRPDVDVYLSKDDGETWSKEEA
jgi:hypothetical protein